MFSNGISLYKKKSLALCITLYIFAMEHNKFAIIHYQMITNSQKKWGPKYACMLSNESTDLSDNLFIFIYASSLCFSLA